MTPPCIITEAFRIGQEIIEASANKAVGYHFAVATEGGHVFTGCPEEYTGDGWLMLDCVGGSPTPIIDIRRIVAITVLEV